ncbi:MAG: hypothetical protein HY353_00545 [Candidatus Omnitrophica bacterium]|nr:hypothetical protein [Candidatus Omnitrophota bacterium]
MAKTTDMRLSRWWVLLGGVVGLGCLQVAQRTAIVMKGYALGERVHRVHTQQTEVSLETMDVAGLSSPVHLAQVAKERRMNLVAWSAWHPEPMAVPLRVASAQPEASD